MGVRGLQSFIDNNPHLSSPHHLHDSTLVFDGNNLLYYLYYGSHADYIYGGDYEKFSCFIKTYFASFKKCNISPIIVFDGAYDRFDSKLNTVKSRFKQRFHVAKVIAKTGSCGEKILPLLAQETMESCLTELNIPMLRSAYEADDQITSLANRLQCPVVSQDSDFYIYDVPQGFIRLDKINTQVQYGSLDEEDVPYFYLKTTIYFVDHFLKFFPQLDRSLLPLFGTLAGNDVMELNQLVHFFNNIHLQKSKSRRFRFNKQHIRLIGLLEWLQDYTLEEAVENVLKFLKKDTREGIQNTLQKSIANYNTLQTNLLQYLFDNENDENANNFEIEILTHKGKELPEWFVRKFHKAELPSSFLNIIGSHRTFLQTQIEDFVEQSVHLDSVHIRQVIYAILLSSDYSFDKNKVMVEEFGRKQNNFCKIKVEPLFEFENLPMLVDIPMLSKDKKCILMEKILQVDLLNNVPENLKLISATVFYTLVHSNPPVTETFVSSLLLCILYFSIIKPLMKEKSVKPEVIEDFSLEQYICSELSLCDLRERIGNQEATFAYNNLVKYSIAPINSRRLDIVPIHQISQFKSAFLFTIQLNKILGLPYSNPKVPEMINGPFIYNMYKNLIARSSLRNYVTLLLGENSWLNIFFLKFLNIFPIENSIIKEIPLKKPKYKLRRKK